MIKLIEKELASLAKGLIARYRPYVIAVTGSTGKTTTKKFVEVLLDMDSETLRVAKGNLNTELGLPMAILGFPSAPKKPVGWLWVMLAAPLRYLFTFSYPKYLLLEYAADKPGDLEYLTSIVAPDISVLTNIGVAHLERYKSEEDLAKEKWVLPQKTKQTVILRKQDWEKVKNFEPTKAEVILVPSTATASVENEQFLSNGTEFELYLAGKKLKASYKYLGRHNLNNLELAAYAAYLVKGVTDHISESIASLAPELGRGERFINKDEILVIDESYNANPASMKAALENFKNIKYGRKVAIMGQMMEIGNISEAAHTEAAEIAREIADFTIGVGPAFKDEKLDRWYPNVGQLIEEMGKIIKKGDAVLIKGSLSNDLEKAVNVLR